MSQHQAPAGRRLIGPVAGYFVETLAYPMDANGTFFIGAYKLWPCDQPRTIVCAGYGNKLTRSVDGALDVAWAAAEPELAGLRPLSVSVSPLTGLLGLIYVSTVKTTDEAGQVKDMLQRARLRNLELHISGILLTRQNTFMQYLEGLAGTVEYVYQRIRNDPLHYGVVEIMRKPITNREFAGWAMASAQVACVDAIVSSEDALIAAAVAMEGSFVKELLSSFIQARCPPLR